MINFSDSYDSEKFQSFLSKLLPDDFLLTNTNIKLRENHQFFKSAKLIGSVKSLNDLKIIQIERIKPEKSRIAITKELFKLLEILGFSTALIITYSTQETHYRFSYIKTELKWVSNTKVKKEYSNPKRLSFLLGQNQKIHTPTSQFIKLGKIRNLEDLNNRFNVEIVNKEFFDMYKKMYFSLESYLKKDNQFNKLAKKIDLQTFVFSKKLLGQIVFCYFLQKKGCLGAKQNTSINKGDKIFLRNKFEEIIKKGKNYYNDFLEHLFYSGFNKENHNSYVEKIDSKVPYLNGGLFEEINGYDVNDKLINLPNEIFSNSNKNGILDILDLYNFTIDENEGSDVEIAVDPEMLGKVFENLLPENLRQELGAFYTPRKVVSYMCEQSLSNYLINNFDQNLIDKSELDSFIKNKEFVINLIEFESEISIENIIKILPDFIIKYKDVFEKLLENIKICDPAIGSGAFAIGMLQEVTKIKKIINFINKKKYSNYELKRNFIENNIYGVDFDPGAVEITKLRLWLSLIIEDDFIKLHPLPNLDFKIMQGDSLTEEFLGISLKLDHKNTDSNQLFLGENVNKKVELVDELFKKQNQYFNLSSLGPKKALKKQIEELIKKIFINEIPKIEINNTKNVNLLKDKIENFGLNYTQRDFFPWTLYFNDVLKSKKGFDIVIGNPPYVDSERMTREMPEKRELYSKKFISTKGNWDIYIPFYELGFNLLNEKGILSFIAPNKWLSIKYGITLREYLNNSLIQICLCEKVKIFEAGNSPTINFFQKNKKREKIQIDEFRADYKSFFLGSISKNNITTDNWGVLLSNNLLNIIKINSSSQNKLKDYYYVENPFSTAEAYLLQKIIVDRNVNRNIFYFINTGTITPFSTSWGSKTTSYLKSKYVNPVVSKEKLKIFSDKRFNQSSSPKIIIKGMRYFDSFYDEKGEFIAGKSTIIVIPKDKNYNLKSLCVLLNSEFIFKYIKSNYSALGIDGGINFSKDIVEDLPLPNKFNKVQKTLENFYDQISLLVNKKKDFLNIKIEADNFIYEIYNTKKDQWLLN